MQQEGPYTPPHSGGNQCKVHGRAVNALGLRPAGEFDSHPAHERKRGGDR